MLDQKEHPEKAQENKKEGLLTKAWPKLHFEGISEDGLFWCAGFTRTEKGLRLVDAVVALWGAPRDEWTFEGSFEIEGPVLIHPIVK